MSPWWPTPSRWDSVSRWPRHLEKKKGVSVEVVDLRTLVPLDKETIIKSVKKTGRLLIVDEGYTSFGVAAEICAAIQDEVFLRSGCAIQRLCAPDVSIPFSPPWKTRGAQ